MYQIADLDDKGSSSTHSFINKAIAQASKSFQTGEDHCEMVYHHLNHDNKFELDFGLKSS